MEHGRWGFDEASALAFAEGALGGALSPEVHALIAEGLHTDPAHPFTSQLNVDMARSLNAEIVLVSDVASPSAVADLRLSVNQFTNEGCKVAGVIFNMAPEDFDQAAAQTETEQWKRIDGRLQQNYANMRKNGVAINTSVPLPVQRALKDAAADSVKNWKAAAGPEAAAILKQTGKR